MVWMSEFIESSWARIFEKSSSFDAMISASVGSGVGVSSWFVIGLKVKSLRNEKRVSPVLHFQLVSVSLHPRHD